MATPTPLGFSELLTRSLSVIVYVLAISLCFVSVRSSHIRTGDASYPQAANGQTFPWNKMRLPDSIIPVHYDLLLIPNLTTLKFLGSMNIEVYVQQETNTIVIHSKHLDIAKATITNLDGTSPPKVLQVLEYPVHEQIAILTAEPLVLGRSYIISFEYTANLSDSFHGFYKSTYRTKDGEVRVLAATQFEPTFARMAFPCFDEPAFKAHFSVRIRRELKHLALSNMPILKSLNIGDNLVEDHFEKSVKMSTYLVAFIVSDFTSISKMTEHGVKISVYTVPEKIEQADFALEAAVKLLDFYEDYFNISYPLPKQDLAAIPDFQSGAMENWGLTTYRESALLYNPETSSASEKLWITMIIAHELAHQWFGNLITMEWWNDLWLNEGFAKFMEYISVNVTHPELQVEDYFLSKCFKAMDVDSLNSSHPVSTPVENPAQILEMFDDVSYDKGACILNMLRDYMTPEAFKAGIVQYLRRYSYRNTKNEDLWDSLTNICSNEDLHDGRMQEDGFCTNSQKRPSSAHWFMEDALDVTSLMNTWTLQKGFPMITVTVKGKQVHLHQELYQKSADSFRVDSYLWHVPLTYITTRSATVHRFLLKTKTDVIILPEEVEWIKFNVDMNGYYIVHYEGEGWDTLVNLLIKNHEAISSNDRANLINNAFLLVSIGKLPLNKALDLTLYLRQEAKIMPVFQGLNELIPIYKLMEKRDMVDVENQLKAYIVNLFKTLIDQQTWTDDGSVSERMLRSQLLMFACVRNYQPCVVKAEEYFDKWKQSNGTLRLPGDIALAVYAVGAQTSEGWDFLFQKYQTSLFSAEKSQIEVALTFSRNPEKLQWLMEESLKGDVVKSQDLPFIVVYVSKNPSGFQLSWNFLKKNWDKLVQKFELGSNLLAHMVVGVTNQYSTREMLHEVKSFFESLKDNGSQLRCVQLAVETIEENIRWMDKYFDQIKAWLEQHQI
ncbi:endoplasmic reticulum aminopeptidase 1 [Protopterus annectens]|uniref:endoplasmic reticulum aminopeptidase 1 n=1 Tax=Protopterus annectens TaxID=7888 RepID=UPI001CFA1776|nr:endoplasmic reticulum aminopeptidase 1 [Protopterus annectens]